MMDFISQHWQPIVFILTCLGGGGGAFYLAKKVEIPKMKADISRLEDDVKQFNGGIADIKACFNNLKKDIQHDRKITYGFMTAVKEKLDLKFTIPDD